MDIIGAIEARRSIRRFKADPVPRQTIERLLDLATKAPSAKNAQPWSFIVLEGEKKNAVAGLLADAVVKYEAQGFPTGSAGPTARIMAEAPVLILVYDRYWIPGEGPPPPRLPAEGFRGAAPANREPDLADTQSIGAAIENLALAALAFGLGTLWIGDVLYIVDQINALVGRDHGLTAAVSVGYPDETPGARPRRHWSELTEWQA